ncbi:MAG: CHAP domain-containing protein [Lachnospiraceae bacterium]|nr:CHAP domain-containing protein [Lachnospiraceae bacterium]
MRKKFIAVAVALVMGFVCLPAITGYIEPIEVKAADDYPDYLRDVPIDSVIDQWNFYSGECTSFAAWCLNSRNGVNFHNGYMGVQWGHAKNWGKAAKSLGIKVDNTPAVGAIAWWDGGTYGHVAWVSEVKSDSVVIEEYNYYYSGKYNTREIKASNPAGYIHIKDIPQEFYLDLNWEVDGEYINGEVSCATADVYINGKRIAKGIKDYYYKWPAGTKYAIKNIKTAKGYVYNGAITGVVKGNVGNQDTEVRLSFSKKQSVTIYDGKWKFLSSGKWISCEIPDGFDKNNPLAGKYNSRLLSDGESNGLKWIVAEKKLKGYIYFHWTHNKYALPNDNYNVFINDRYCWEGWREYYNFRAFFSTVDYGHKDKNGINGGDCFYAWFDNPEDGSWWWFRIPVYEQTYDMYEEITGVNGKIGAPID